MRAVWRDVGIWAGLAGLAWGAPLDVEAQPLPCASESVVTGDVTLGGALVHALSAAARAAACEADELSVTRTPGGYRVRLGAAGRSVEREIATIDDAIVWTESWLAAVQSPAGEPAPAATVTVARTSETATVEAAQPAVDAPDEPREPGAVYASALGWLVGATFDASVDTYGAWLGPEVIAAWSATPSLWLGFALGGAWGIEGGSQAPEVERTALRATARLGGAIPVLGASLRPGIGLGVGSFGSSVRDASGTIREEEAGLVVELGVQGIVPLAGPLALVVELGGRWHVRELGADPEDEAELRTFQIPELVGSGRVGLAWTFGGAP